MNARPTTPGPRSPVRAALAAPIYTHLRIAVCADRRSPRLLAKDAGLPSSTPVYRLLRGKGLDLPTIAALGKTLGMSLTWTGGPRP